MLSLDIQLKEKHKKLTIVNHCICQIKTGQIKLNFYDKESERKAKGDLLGTMKYKNVLRIEVQNRKEKIKSNTKKGIKPILDNYFCEDGFKEDYLDVISPYLYEGGDYYTLHQAKLIINRSKLQNSMKVKLKNFLEAVIKYGGVKNAWKNGYCGRGTALGYVEKLVELGVNPITIDKNSNYTHLDNLMKFIRNIADTQYFC